MRWWDSTLGIGLRALAVLATVVAVAGITTSRAAETGPTLEVGTPQLQSGKVAIPIAASGSGFSPFAGFQVHLRWDPAIFQLDSATSAGGPFDAAAGRGLCVGPITNLFDSDGGGMLFSCATIGSAGANPTGPGVTAAGMIATVLFTPKGQGCSVLHLVTLGGADGGDSQSGSYTDSADGSAAAQDNQYVDGSADADGHSCQPSAAAPTVQPDVTPATPPPDAQSTVPVEAPTDSAAAAVTGTPPAVTSPESSTSVATPSAVGATAAPGNATPVKSITGIAGGAATGTASATGSIAGSQGTSNTSGGGSSKAPIVGIVVAALIVVGAGAGSFYFVRLRRRT